MSGTHYTKAEKLQEATDGELLRMWCEGDPDGLAELVARHHAWVLRTIRFVSFRERDVEGVAQEVWLDVMRGADSYRGATSIRSWFEAIVRNRVATTWRKQRARPENLVDVLPDGVRVDEGAAQQVEVREQVWGALERLPIDQREAVWAVDVLGLSITDAATRLGAPTGTIKSRCNRGRERLRVVLARE